MLASFPAIATVVRILRFENVVVAISDSASAPYVEGKRVTTLGLCMQKCM